MYCVLQKIFLTELQLMIFFIDKFHNLSVTHLVIKMAKKTEKCSSQFRKKPILIPSIRMFLMTNFFDI